MTTDAVHVVYWLFFNGIYIYIERERERERKEYSESTEPIDAVKYIYTEGYSESTEPLDAVNILPLARFEPTTSATPPSTTPDTELTNCTTETFPKKDVQEALILTTTAAVHVVYWLFSMGGIYFVRM